MSLKFQDANFEFITAQHGFIFRRNSMRLNSKQQIYLALIGRNWFVLIWSIKLDKFSSSIDIFTSICHIHKCNCKWKKINISFRRIFFFLNLHYTFVLLMSTSNEWVFLLEFHFLVHKCINIWTIHWIHLNLESECLCQTDVINIFRLS